MTIFTVQTTLKHDNGNPKYLYIETEHAGIASLLADLRQGPVCCKKLHAFYDREHNKMVVSEAKEFALGMGIVGSIEQQTLPFVEAGARAAA
jgi:hypothetical protein